MQSPIRNDLSESMRFALKRAFVFKQRMPSRMFTAANCESIQPTMDALFKRGYVTQFSGYRYELSEKAIKFLEFHFPTLVSPYAEKSA